MGLSGSVVAVGSASLRPMGCRRDIPEQAKGCLVRREVWVRGAGMGGADSLSAIPYPCTVVKVCRPAWVAVWAPCMAVLG